MVLESLKISFRTIDFRSFNALNISNQEVIMITFFTVKAILETQKPVFNYERYIILKMILANNVSSVIRVETKNSVFLLYTSFELS